MSETTETLTAVPNEPQEEKKSRLQTFKANHPKASKALAVTGVAALLLGTVATVKGLRKDHSPEFDENPEGYAESVPETPMVTEG